MTRERAKELLPVIQAFAEGKAIQFLSNCPGVVWLDSDNLDFLDDYKYRIKPEPQEVWIYNGVAYPTRDLAKLAKGLCGGVIFHFREVL